MRIDRLGLVVLLGGLMLAGCAGGAREVDYSQQRGISSDISSSLEHGPTASKPGMVGEQEPLGAMPWQIPTSRQ
ncbi:MAG TPA: hypothetical protein VLV50_08690 [Stellaceae bacterium]|nr:hypothetical protein [Stellaceae bacterium]